MKISLIGRILVLVIAYGTAMPLHAECKRVNGIVVCPKPGTTPGGGDLMTVPELKKRIESLDSIEDQIRDLKGQLETLEGLNG